MTVVGDGVAFLPQFIGIPDDAAGFVFVDGQPAADRSADLLGAGVRVEAGTELGNGWWYLRPGDR